MLANVGGLNFRAVNNKSVVVVVAFEFVSLCKTTLKVQGCWKCSLENTIRFVR